MDVIEQFATELQGMRETLDLVVEKLDTLIFNFNMIHQSQVDQGTELSSLKAQCARRSLRCPVLASYPPAAPTPTPVPDNGEDL